MDPLTMGIISAGAGLLGTGASNQQSREESSENRAWQQHMSSTAHQREVNDLRAAGLNPMLSLGGSGAAVPGGSTASISDLGPGLSKGMDTAIGIRAQNKQLDLQDADIDLKHDQATNLAGERNIITKDTQIKNQHVAQEAVKTKILQKTADAAIKKAKAEGDYAQVNQLMGVISSGASSASDIKDIVNPVSGIIKLKKGK